MKRLLTIAAVAALAACSREPNFDDTTQIGPKSRSAQTAAIPRPADRSFETAGLVEWPHAARPSRLSDQGAGDRAG